MTTEEQKDLMAKIGNLAGYINRHKNQRPVPESSGVSQHRFSPYQPARPTRGASTYRRGGGYRGGGPHMPHRHRTLVLNGTGAQAQPEQAADEASSSDPQATWVSKTDRHLQLINSNVYEKESHARTKAIFETNQRKIGMKDDQEKAKLDAYLRAVPAGAAVARPANGSGPYELTVEGIRFLVAKDGSKLVKAADDINPPSATPKVALVGGVRFLRSKTGNLYRNGIVQAHRKSGKIKKIDEPCRIFSTTGGPVCRRFGLYGYCEKGSLCTERHVFECPDFSNTGKCKIKGCKLVHRERASVLRKAAGQRDGDDDAGDVSSDSDSVASDDVDSDEVEELFGDEDPDQSAFTEQKDYISF